MLEKSLVADLKDLCSFLLLEAQLKIVSRFFLDFRSRDEILHDTVYVRNQNESVFPRNELASECASPACKRIFHPRPTDDISTNCKSCASRRIKERKRPDSVRILRLFDRAARPYESFMTRRPTFHSVISPRRRKSRSPSFFFAALEFSGEARSAPGLAPSYAMCVAMNINKLIAAARSPFIIASAMRFSINILTSTITIHRECNSIRAHTFSQRHEKSRLPVSSDRNERIPRPSTRL